MPPRVSDMLAVRIGQLTAEVFHLLDLQPCWLLRRLCHLALAFPIERDVTNSRAPSLHGRYPTSSLLRARPPPSRLRSTSRFSRLYDLPCSSDFSSGTREASPTTRYVLVTVLSLPPRRGEQPYRSVFGWSFCLRPSVAGSAPGDTHFRGHNAFTFVTAQ